MKDPLQSYMVAAMCLRARFERIVAQEPDPSARMNLAVAAGLLAHGRCVCLRRNAHGVVVEVLRLPAREGMAQ